MIRPMTPRCVRRFVSWALALALSLGAVSPGFAAMVAPAGERFAIAQPICTSAGLAGHGSTDPAAPSSPADGHPDACPLCATCSGCAPGPQRASALAVAAPPGVATAIGAQPARSTALRLAARPRAPPAQA